MFVATRVKVKLTKHVKVKSGLFQIITAKAPMTVNIDEISDVTD
jgi:hypothetical protein